MSFGTVCSSFTLSSGDSDFSGLLRVCDPSRFSRFTSRSVTRSSRESGLSRFTGVTGLSSGSCDLDLSRLTGTSSDFVRSGLTGTLGLDLDRRPGGALRPRFGLSSLDLDLSRLGFGEGEGSLFTSGKCLSNFGSDSSGESVLRSVLPLGDFDRGGDLDFVRAVFSLSGELERSLRC